MLGFLAATVSEIFLGTAVAGLGTKIAVESIKKDSSEAHHRARLDEIKVKAEKAKEAEAKAEKAKEERDAQELAIHLIRNKKAFGGLSSVFSIFSKP